MVEDISPVAGVGQQVMVVHWVTVYVHSLTPNTHQYIYNIHTCIQKVKLNFYCLHNNLCFSLYFVTFDLTSGKGFVYLI